MAISKCISLFNESSSHINETGQHGSIDFPIAIYLDDVSKQFVNWHWHEEFEIGIIVEGSIVFGSGNRQYRMECDDIFFVNSNVLHSMRNTNSSKSAVFKSIAFHPSLICDSTSSIFYTKYLLPILSNSHFREYVLSKDHALYSRFQSILLEVWNLVQFESPDYEIMVRNLLSNLLCLLNQIQKDEYPLVPNLLVEKRVQILLDCIHTNYKEKITIEMLAKIASVSKTEVLRSFKSIMSLSPIQYLNNYRLQRASFMLMNTDLGIQEIAQECGFDDNSYFAKLFKKKYLVSPKEFRSNKK